MRYCLLVIAFCAPLSAYAGNIKDTDLISSNTFFLPPSIENTIFVQARNASDNQDVTLHDLPARLTAKGYQISQDPDAANYVVLANIVYCNLSKPEMPVEAIVAAGYGAGVGSSIMGGLQSLTSVASMMGPQGAMAGGAASMGLSAISGIGSAVGSLFGSSKPKMPDDVDYACVADVQISDRSAAKRGEEGIYQTRLAATISQKKMNQDEATPIIQDKISTGLAGLF